ncbi:hypothetical protein [Calothrix sp. 336/3]|uniref:hypothetical protein n=1 Tax=Calothrix sp. 336/3 TaxID=1337936 RepID=UPI0004E2F56D|nr:hypothetical protein [Calothrix sp. 336/3]AKG24908.1 hypothetical protein IJ00_26560 [Calothrix sp. 336/3]
MAELKRVRLEEDLQQYLETQSERILGKAPETLTPIDYSTLVNRALYEHKLAHSMTRNLPLGRLVDWLLNLPASARNLSVIAPRRVGEGTTTSEPDDYSFDAQLGDLFEQEAA